MVTLETYPATWFRIVLTESFCTWFKNYPSDIFDCGNGFFIEYEFNTFRIKKYNGRNIIGVSVNKPGAHQIIVDHEDPVDPEMLPKVPEAIETIMNAYRVATNQTVQSSKQVHHSKGISLRNENNQWKITLDDQIYQTLKHAEEPISVGDTLIKLSKGSDPSISLQSITLTGRVTIFDKTHAAFFVTKMKQLEEIFQHLSNLFKTFADGYCKEF